MPHSTKTINQDSTTRAERAKQYLTFGGILREDSDDELGLEDHPWQWLYSDEKGDSPSKSPNIIGARMGDFRCFVGDCVLLKAEGNKEAWIGLICNFEEDEEEDEMVANFMWFSTDKEIRNKQKKRTDALWVYAPLKYLDLWTKSPTERSLHYTILGSQSFDLY